MNNDLTWKCVNGWPYSVSNEGHALGLDALDLINQLLEDKKQLERERDAAVETAMFLAGTNFAFPCESDELACSEYCERHCNFSTAQKECWLEYFRRCGAPKEVE